MFSENYLTTDTLFISCYIYVLERGIRRTNHLLAPSTGRQVAAGGGNCGGDGGGGGGGGCRWKVEVEMEVVAV